MLTKHVFALLSLGGTLRATRTFPSPYHYVVEAPAFAPVELSEDDVIALLDRHRIAPPPAADVGDSYSYTLADPVWVRDRALDGFVIGFGRCPVCEAFPLAVMEKGVAPRHGHSPKSTPSIPPCEGSGKPLVSVVTREPLAALRDVA
jgi:hypothetical protein